MATYNIHTWHDITTTSTCRCVENDVMPSLAVFTVYVLVTADRPSNGQTKHCHYTVHGLVLPSDGTASCRRETNYDITIVENSEPNVIS